MASKYLANRSSQFAQAYMKFSQKKPQGFRPFEDCISFKDPKIRLELRSLTALVDQMKAYNPVKEKQRSQPPPFDWYEKHISAPGIVSKIKAEYERVVNDKSRFPIASFDVSKHLPKFIENMEKSYDEMKTLTDIIADRRAEIQIRVKELEYEMTHLETISVEDQLKENPIIERAILKDINHSNWDQSDEIVELQVSEAEKAAQSKLTAPVEILKGAYAKRLAEKFLVDYLDAEEKKNEEAAKHEHH